MKAILFALALGLSIQCAFAVDGQILINQSTVMAAGGFPYVISQPGSYKLSGNLSVPAGHDAIDINASNVTLDLNGFNISAEAFSKTYAINSQNTSNVVVKNGTITGWEIAISFTNSTRLITIEGINALTNLGPGNGGAAGVAIWIDGSNNFVRRITTDGSVVLSCPSVILDSLAEVQTTGNGCVSINTGHPDWSN